MVHGHRFFAAFWDWRSRHEGPAERTSRRLVVGDVPGRVLELGCGVGTNWRYLPDGADYVGIDPDAFMLARARRRAATGGCERPIVQARAEQLPFRTGSFDAVIATLTLCTIDDVAGALAEVRRVLKPGGEFRFWEHVNPRGRVAGRAVDAITPVWRFVGAGCRPNRDALAAIQRAGFTVRQMSRARMGPVPVILGVGVASEGTGHAPKKPGAANR